MANSHQSLVAAILSRFLSGPVDTFVSGESPRFPDIWSDSTNFQNKDSLILLFYTGMVSTFLFTTTVRDDKL